MAQSTSVCHLWDCFLQFSLERSRKKLVAQEMLIKRNKRSNSITTAKRPKLLVAMYNSLHAPTRPTHTQNEQILATMAHSYTTIDFVCFGVFRFVLVWCGFHSWHYLLGSSIYTHKTQHNTTEWPNHLHRAQRYLQCFFLSIQKNKNKKSEQQKWKKTKHGNRKKAKNLFQRCINFYTL